MARKPERKTARKASPTIDENSLTIGQLRKLNALRKSVGEKIGTTAFAKWLAAQPTAPKEPVDKSAERIVAALEALTKESKLRLPRGGYLVKRGWGGSITVTRAETQ